MSMSVNVGVDVFTLIWFNNSLLVCANSRPPVLIKYYTATDPNLNNMHTEGLAGAYSENYYY